ncbi:uncharacterized protein LOC125672027 [Ostrea edulis]|uniref:uncharacterized protein LOC125672027 n=1 Tax=Ostrea edulis TaxID=37623 RepID=UPI0024AF1A63|nr:uncharacterized protein LOC125672027 [Ostrea edulis]
MTRNLLCVVAVLGLSQSVIGGSPHQPILTKRGALSYVVSQGCPYLVHYVHDNYFSYRRYRQVSPSTTAPPTLNWVTYVYDRGVANYVPMELIHGYISCGMKYALYAVKAPSNILQQLHADFSGIPGVLG